MGRCLYAKTRLILDTDNAGNLVIRPTGQDGAVVLTTNDGKRVRYEERQGKILVSHDPGSDEAPDLNPILNN